MFTPPTRKLHRRNARRCNVRRRGISVLETAFVLPLLAALTLGIVEYGYFFYVHHSIQGAARQGARAGALDGGTNADVTAAVQQAIDNASLKNIPYTVTIHNGSGGATSADTAAAGDSIAVDVDIQWADASLVKLTPFLGEILFPTKAHGSTVMRKEG